MSLSIMPLKVIGIYHMMHQVSVRGHATGSGLLRLPTWPYGKWLERTTPADSSTCVKACAEQ
jgi:hypothetical protein